MKSELINNLDFQKEDLELPEGLGDFIGVISTGENGSGRIHVDSAPFKFPSIGTIFSRVTYISDKEEKTYFVKRFSEDSFSESGKPLAYKRERQKSPPAKIEHKYLEAFRKLGCSVPASRSINGHTLIMEDCGSLTLEEKIRNKSPESQEELLEILLHHQARLSFAGRKLYNEKSIPRWAYSGIPKRSDLDNALAYIFNYWRPGASKEEKSEFIAQFSFISDILKRNRRQLIWGDSTTYHVLFVDERSPRFIDFERIKEGHKAQDLAGIYFSPEVRLGFEAVERLLYNSYQKEYELCNIEHTKSNMENWEDHLRIFYCASLFECLRRGTKIRELAAYYPDVYSRFIDRHSGFRKAFMKYRRRITEIKDRVSGSDFFSKKEQEKFEVAADAALNLVSK